MRAIIELGQALGLEVIAEGIERADQIRPLRDLGCRFGQGYLYARPMDPAALGGILDGPALHREETLVALPERPRPRRRTRSAASAGAADRRAG